MVAASGLGMVSFVKSNRRPLTEGAKRQCLTRIHSIGFVIDTDRGTATAVVIGRRPAGAAAPVNSAVQQGASQSTRDRSAEVTELTVTMGHRGKHTEAETG
jgi:hypothetical protein